MIVPWVQVTSNTGVPGWPFSGPAGENGPATAGPLTDLSDPGS